jgi:hypothetical protein
MTDGHVRQPLPSKTNSDIQDAAEALSELSNQRDAVLAAQLARVVAAVAREATKSPRLAKALGAAFDPGAQSGAGTAATAQRPHRRAPGVLDPFMIYAETGEDGLRKRLTDLDLDQLRDILAEHRLDHDRLAMRWRDPVRVIERIVDRVTARASKGSAFRS